MSAGIRILRGLSLTTALALSALGAATAQEAATDAPAEATAEGATERVEAAKDEAGVAVDLALPSGQKVRWLETLRDVGGPAGLTYRFRFLAPAIAKVGGSVGPEAVQLDMQVLCDGFALPRLSNIGPQPQQLVISLSDRPVAFGVAEPGVTQYFEAYRPEGGACVWDAY